MKHTIETLIELQDHIEELNDSVGLEPDTYNDITEAIEKKKVEINKCSIDHVMPRQPCGNCLKQPSPCRSINCQYHKVVMGS